jgi:hypothetical protein
MSNGADKVVFFVDGGKALGDYLMYTPPMVGDDVTFGDGETYTVVERNFDMPDNTIRVTVWVKTGH